MRNSIVRRCLGFYLFQSKRIWRHLPASLRLSPLGRVYGTHLHALVRIHDQRNQNHSTFFLRNRPELNLIRRLLDERPQGARLNLAVLACSKGAEVYSTLWAIRSTRPDLRVSTHAVDIAQEILEVAANGVYSLETRDVVKTPNGEVSVNVFDRMSPEEVGLMFEVEGTHAKVRPWVKEGIVWVRGDAGDPKLIDLLGGQDVVMANRFLCHMEPAAAERCLLNIARLVRPGGYLFVSGVDLDVRTKVAKAMDWRPVMDLMREIHEGDAASLRDSWPMEYWGLEPFCARRPDWRVRYASVFQIGEMPSSDRTFQLQGMHSD